MITLVSDLAHPDHCCLDLYVMNADGSHLHSIVTDQPAMFSIRLGSGGDAMRPGHRAKADSILEGSPRMRRISRLTAPLLALSLMVGLFLVPGTAAQATFPGANGRIVFDDFVTGQTYAVNPDGTGLVQLTHVARGQFAGDPSWSPDATHIAYESTHGGVIRLWIMDADGRHQHMVADDLPNAADVGPAYTPDGTRLVYYRCLGRACAIYSIGVDGTHRRALTPFVRPPFEVFDVYPSVAPDGTIAFSRFNQNVEGIISQVYVMDADGSNPHPSRPRYEAWSAGWSHSERISFSSNCCRLGTNRSAGAGARPAGAWSRIHPERSWRSQSRCNECTTHGSSWILRSHRWHGPKSSPPAHSRRSSSSCATLNRSCCGRSTPTHSWSGGGPASSLARWW